MIASERVVRAVYARLAGDATLATLLGTGKRIFEGSAGLNQSLPFLVIDIPSAIDLTAIGGARMWEDTLVSVTVRGKTGATSQAVPIADRVDELLHDYGVTVDGVAVANLTRERGVRLPLEVVDGLFYPALYLEYRTYAAVPA